MTRPFVVVPRALLLALVVAAVGTGCASGGGITPRDDAGRMDAGPASEVCDPPCVGDEVCSAGSCVPGTTDGDGDGLGAAVDCDDTDPSIGRTAEVPCSGGCGAGVERCFDGEWLPCTAPTSCDCEVGEPARSIACGNCGIQRQTCVGGRWTDEGTCTGAGPCAAGEEELGGTCGSCGTQRRTCGEDCSWSAWSCQGEGTCAPGATETETRSCGSCDLGMQVRTRTCSGACGWGEWGEWSACTGPSVTECTVGQTETRTQPCGSCGTQRQTRTCSSSCSWGAWTNSGTCTGQGVCSPGATTACDPVDSCGQRVCTSSCSWSACQPRIPGGCVRRRSPTQPDGSNYRCCRLSASDEGWQFCLASCQWSTSCEATNNC